MKIISIRNKNSLKNISKTTLILCRKTLGILVAMLIIVSLNATSYPSTVHAVKIPSSKESLVKILPKEWIAFWNAVDVARAVDMGAIWEFVVNSAMEATGRSSAWDTGNAAAWKALRAIDSEDVSDSTINTVWNSAFAVAWKSPDGAAYLVVKDNDIEYFKNLITVLRNQTEILCKLAQSSSI